MLIINRESKEQVYRQLYRQIRAEIETGVRQAGSVMPSTRFLAKQLAVSRNTIDHAYQELVAEGYIISKPASGYHVTNHLPFVVQPVPTTSQQTGQYRYDFTERYDYLQLFPTQAWQTAEREVLRRGIEHIQPLGGDLSYREQLASYLARLKNIHVSPEQIVVTSGFNEAANIIGHLVPELRTTGLGVAEPIAPNARGVWQTLDVPIQLFRSLDQLPNAGGYVLCPTHNFPDGMGLDANQRAAFAARMQASQRYLIELDTDGTLVYSGQPAPAIHHYLDGQRCFYYTNFDDTLGSSLCAGVLVLPTDMVAPYHDVYAQLPNRNSQLQQRILAQMIASDDLERYLRQLTVVYHNRRQLLLETLTAQFGDSLKPIGTAAGSFVTMAITSEQSATPLIQQAAAAGIGLVDPDRCWHNLAPAYPSVVLSFRQASDEVIQEGISALADVWEQLRV